LLRHIGIDFDVVPSEVDEKDHAASTEPVLMAEALARAKAEDVASREDGLVVGADTIVVIDGEVLGKPVDAAEAVRMLTKLAGRTHTVITGLAVKDSSGGHLRVTHETTQVTMRNLTPQEVVAYVASGEPMDKAGAYAVQGLGALLVERIEGCYFNVVGLPLARLGLMLEEFGVRFL
jgi:septum formation protein